MVDARGFALATEARASSEGMVYDTSQRSVRSNSCVLAYEMHVDRLGSVRLVAILLLSRGEWRERMLMVAMDERDHSSSICGLSRFYTFHKYV